MLWGFFDESGEHDERGDLTKLTLGGCWASFENWEALSIEWSQILDDFGINVFHMTDFEANKGEFSGWENKRKEHKTMLNSLLDTMCRHIEEFSGFTKPLGSLSVGDIYEQNLIELFVHSGIHDEHSIVIARHPEYGPQSIGQLVNAIETLLGKGAIRVKTWTIGEPKDFCPLQAADMVAYEIRCWWRNKELHRPMRYPLRRLQERMTSGWLTG